MATLEAPLSRASWDDLPPKWRRLFGEHLPGYDPVATAAPGEWFDVEAAEGASEFFREWLVFVEGEKAGEAFELEPWQEAIVGCLIGWKRSDGLRRYRESLIYVPRKSGKTPMCAGLVNYMLFCDDEPGAQLVSAAADREQASHVFRHAAHMVMRNPELDKHVKIYRTYKSIELSADGSVYKALSSDANTKHGSNLSFIIVDELHAHPSRDLVDVLSTGTGSRRQPLMIYITTADYDRESICNEKHDYATKVRDQVVGDSAFLPVVYEAAPDDDWTSPETWTKVNPNLDVSVRREYLERECKRAQDQPSYENTFKRLHLNIKTQQDVRWISLPAWDACPDNGIGDAVRWREWAMEHLAGRRCVEALDLSSKMDLTADVLVFPPSGDDELWYVLPWLFVPREGAAQRSKTDRVPYLEWAKQGFITLTDGNVVDYEWVKSQIRENRQRFDVQEVAYDPWNATQIALQLQEEGASVVEFQQGYRSMSEPTKELERLIAAKLIAHGHNPVLRWMASHVAADMDPAGNIKPSKKKSTERIDGLVATIMAIGRAMVAEEKQESIYETRGPLVF